ncbi:alcohol dehydrogenase [Athelia psychrophila]|uniref:Alcohol dehydrogenase n=1 Tax=Athelia psychrophila TaxID=1759441 RepID=A0A166J523_9AGAM|nr:alcohol dehydrogenase [Fibularhizoctonia sp. CBS 109695]KZP20508.1 alcohol dehydrogenase [Fibularhizoctonia sp. CBS 109695]
MAPVQNARLIYSQHPTTYPVPGQTFVYDDSPTIDLNTVPLHGGILVKTIVLSSDPYLRGRMHPPEVKSYMPPMEIGQPVDNFGIGLILRSEDSNFHAGMHVYGYCPFQEYSIINMKASLFPWFPLEKPEGVNWSTFIGPIGMPGQSAYLGYRALVEEKAKTSKTLFISVAGGPVGNFLIQFIKIRHPEMKIIASAGTAQKLENMKSLGADVVINYKTDNTRAILAEHGPIDIYWDNAAGPVLDDALVNMAEYGLIVACGAISSYNQEEKDRPPTRNFVEMFQRSLTVRGYRGTDFAQQYIPDFMAEIPPLVFSGKIRLREHRYDGLKNAGQALADVHTGANFGKSLIVVADDACMCCGANVCVKQSAADSVASR